MAYSTSKKPNNGDSAIPRSHTVAEATNTEGLKQRSEQDRFYERSSQNSTADPVPQSEINVVQEKAKHRPLPDGTIPAISTSDILDSNSSTSDSTIDTSPQPSARTITEANDARKAHLESESQIPSIEAKPPPDTSSHIDPVDPTGSGLRVEQDRDVFYSPSSDASPVLSSLPRIKVPKLSADIQEGDEHVPEDGINQDVFYSSKTSSQEVPVPGAQAIPKQDEPSEHMYSELFHSPKVARMLHQKPKTKSAQDNIRLQRLDEATPKHTKKSTVADQESYATPSGRPSADGATKEADDVGKLATDIADDVGVSPANAMVNDSADAPENCC